MGIIAWIIIGIVAGWLAEQIMGRNHGLLTNLVVGVIGALIGGFVAGALGISWGGWIGSTIIATIGAIILLFLLGLIKRRAGLPAPVAGTSRATPPGRPTAAPLPPAGAGRSRSSLADAIAGASAPGR